MFGSNVFVDGGDRRGEDGGVVGKSERGEKIWDGIGWHDEIGQRAEKDRTHVNRGAVVRRTIVRRHEILDHGNFTKGFAQLIPETFANQTFVRRHFFRVDRPEWPGETMIFIGRWGAVFRMHTISSRPHHDAVKTVSAFVPLGRPVHAGYRRPMVMKIGKPPTRDDIAEIAAKARDQIPNFLRQRIKDVPILVEDFPDDETAEAMGLDSVYDLLGLYQGVSLDQKSVFDTPDDIDRILLYRRPLLEYWCECGESLEDVVINTLIHEIGHHFGFSDADMHLLESSAEDDEASHR